VSFGPTNGTEPVICMIVEADLLPDPVLEDVADAVERHA
jgi:hypothetical protein